MTIARISSRTGVPAFRCGVFAALIAALPIQAIPTEINAAVAAVNRAHLTESQLAQFEALLAAREQGLDPTDYGLERLEALAAASPDGGGQQQLGLLVEQAFQVYAQDAAYGRLEPAVADPDWHIPAPARVVPDEHGVTVIEQLAPPHPAYHRLHVAMIRYLAIQREGGWLALPAGPDLSMGMRNQRVEIARNRLRLTGDFNSDTQADAWLFGANLEAAVRSFQERHGLRIDGVIGAATRVAMNVPVELRIQQLSIAMERWRWLPRDLGDEYVWVNAARLTLEIINDDESVFSTKTIVGHSTRPTPSLQSEIRRLVFNPTWTVPVTIATEDLLPKLQRDPGFLERNGFRVYVGWGDNARELEPANIDWAAPSAELRAYRFVQSPGPQNSLGRVKVVFSNPFDIYLHDTPTRGLFTLRTRTFSSGCVRLEQANEFSDFLLANYRKPGDTTATQWLENPRTQSVELQRRIPIYLVYITSWVTETGQVNFRRDLYRRDEAVTNAMQIDRMNRLADR